MITEDYVSFEQAKKLKELGFPQELFYGVYFYSDDGNVQVGIPPIVKVEAVRPTLDFAAKWLRTEKGIHVVPEPICSDNDAEGGWMYSCYIIQKGLHGVRELQEQWYSYEQALLSGIDKAIEILKKTK